MLKRVAIFVACSLLLSCSKAVQDPIGAKSDQAWIQDVVVQDSVQNELTVIKDIPKIIIDPVTNVERLDTSMHYPSPLPIIITVKAGTDITRLNVRFTLSSQSKYASVSPVLGYLQNFSRPGIYTLTSQSGKNVTAYQLVVKMP